jgi:hypothetical protein
VRVDRADAAGRGGSDGAVVAAFQYLADSIRSFASIAA